MRSSDWSSDVCSSDLPSPSGGAPGLWLVPELHRPRHEPAERLQAGLDALRLDRGEAEAHEVARWLRREEVGRAGLDDDAGAERPAGQDVGVEALRPLQPYTRSAAGWPRQERRQGTGRAAGRGKEGE